MKPLLSIVIPTKDRYATLFPVLKALLKYIDGADYEIIIQDNTAFNNQALEELQTINDARIKYFYNPSSLNVSENSDLAISHCSGEYLVFIGDDDLVSPHILKIVSQVKTEALDCLIFDKGNYYWKDLKMTKEYAFHYPASLNYSSTVSNEIKILSVLQEREYVLNAGGDSYYNQPSLYHGIVKREVMNKVKDKFGSYVPGSCPDIAISTSLTCVVEKYGFMSYPVTIAGASKNSAAGMGVRNAHISRIEDVPWLPKDILVNWDPKIPRIWTGLTIYAQNIHEVFKKAGIDQMINYGKLYNNMYIKEPKTKKLVLPFLLSTQNGLYNKIKTLLYCSVKSMLFSVLYALPSSLINVRYHLKGDFKKRIQIRKMDSVEDCMKHLINLGI